MAIVTVSLSGILGICLLGVGAESAPTWSRASSIEFNCYSDHALVSSEFDSLCSLTYLQMLLPNQKTKIKIETWFLPKMSFFPLFFWAPGAQMGYVLVKFDTELFKCMHTTQYLIEEL